jgi:predicted dehydrogenase
VISPPMRIAIVGAGAIAGHYARLMIEDAARFTLVGVADVDPRAREVFASAHPGIDTFATAAELLAAVRPEAALVATPPVSHEAVSTMLLDHGVHVLCEKPLAIHVPAATRMLHAASQAGRTLMMASKFRYVAAVQEAQRLLHEGVIGDVVTFDNVFCSRVAMTGRWNAEIHLSGGGVWIDAGAHSVDLVRFLIGPVRRVLVTPARRVQAIHVEDTVRVMMEAGHGAMGVADLSWSLHKETDVFFAVHGSKGTLQLGWRTSRYRLADAEDWVTFGEGYDKRLAFAGQLENFAAVVRDLAPPVIRIDDAVESVRVVEAGYRSLRTGRFASVHLHPGEHA